MGIILFLLTLASLIYYFYNKKLSIKLPLAKASLLLGIVFGILFILNIFLVNVRGQDVGVVISPGGIRDTELKTGLHIVEPWCDVKFMDKTQWVYTFSNKKEKEDGGDDAIWVPTKDGIKLGFDFSVTWKINENEASWIYSNISENEDQEGGRYYFIENNIIKARAKSALALVVSNYTPIQAYSGLRQEIQTKVEKKLKELMKDSRILIVQADIREVFYNAEYEKAINAKKLAEQEALRLVDVTRQKEELLTQAKIEKDIAIQKAEGEAKSLQIKGTAIASNPKIVALEWINRWNGELPRFIGGGNTSNLIQLPSFE